MNFDDSERREIEQLARKAAQLVLQEYLAAQARKQAREAAAHEAAYEDAMAYKMYGSE